MKHTKGPWRSGGFIGTSVFTSNAKKVCTCDATQRGDMNGEAAANAKLIAAAPELIEALTNAYEKFSKFGFIWEDRETIEGQHILSSMRSAIKKATK